MLTATFSAVSISYNSLLLSIPFLFIQVNFPSEGPCNEATNYIYIQPTHTRCLRPTPQAAHPTIPPSPKKEERKKKCNSPTAHPHYWIEYKQWFIHVRCNQSNYTRTPSLKYTPLFTVTFSAVFVVYYSFLLSNMPTSHTTTNRTPTQKSPLRTPLLDIWITRKRFIHHKCNQSNYSSHLSYYYYWLRFMNIGLRYMFWESGAQYIFKSGSKPKHKPWQSLRLMVLWFVNKTVLNLPKNK